jgi:hypothetical protein
MRGLRRLIGVSGIVSVVLVAVGFFGGTAPEADDSGRAVLAYAVDHRTFVLVFFFLYGIATGLMLLFFAGLRRILAVPDRPERDVWPSAMLASAVAVFTLSIAAYACAAALAFRSDAQTPGGARTLWDLFMALIDGSNLLTIILGVAALVAIVQRRDVLPRWLGIGAGVFALAHLGATVSWARSGAFSQTGVFSVLAPVFYLAWVLALSVVVLRTEPGTA